MTLPPTNPTPKRPRRRVVSLTLLGIVVAMIFAKQATKPPPVTKLAPSRETTFLVEPARDDGTVDYAAALLGPSSAAAAGVTSENNAAPLLAVALGIEPTWLSERERAALPKIERPFVALPLPPTTIAAFRRGTATTNESAAVVKWLDEMRPALDLAATASKRDRFHVPQASLALGPHFRMSSLEALAIGFSLRACRVAEEERPEQAISALAAGLRIARFRHLPASPQDELRVERSTLDVLEGAIGVALGECRRPATPAAEWRRLASEIDRGPVDAGLRRALEGARIATLERLTAVYRGELGNSDTVRAMGERVGADAERIENASARALENARVAAGFGGLDPNQVLGRFNRQWDRVESILLD